MKITKKALQAFSDSVALINNGTGTTYAIAALAERYGWSVEQLAESNRQIGEELGQWRENQKTSDRVMRKVG